MYYLNSDGSLDKTTLLSDIPAESAVTTNSSSSTADDYRGCNCNICSRKRKKRSIYPRWFSWINIIIFLLLVGVIVMISCSGNKIFTLFSGSSSNNTVSNFSEKPNKIMPPPPPPQTPVAGAAADGNDFELPLL
jgi:hypothetical protein